MLDEIIDKLVEQDELSLTEVEELNKKIKDHAENKTDIPDNKLDSEIEKVLKEELGDDYEDIVNELEEDKSSSIKITSKIVKKNKIGIKSSTIKKEEDETNNLKELYKNRKK